MKIKQNGGLQQALNVVNSCKPFPSKVLLIMKSINGIVNMDRNLDSNVSAKLTTNPSAPINLTIVCENPKDTESNDSKETNGYITVDNQHIETSSKRQKTLSSLTSQNRNTNTATLYNGASCSYTVIANILTVKLKEFANSNWDSGIICSMSYQRIPRSYFENMQNVFKYTKRCVFKCIRFKMDVVYKR